MVKVISTPGPKAIYIEKLKLAVLYKLDNHEIFPRLRGLFSSVTYLSTFTKCVTKSCDLPDWLIQSCLSSCVITCH